MLANITHLLFRGPTLVCATASPPYATVIWQCCDPIGHCTQCQRGCQAEVCVFRVPEAMPRSSLSPAGGPPSASPHCTTTLLAPLQQSKALRVRVVTFNMNFQAVTEVPDQLLGRAGCPPGLSKYDIVVVGTQESGPLQVILNASMPTTIHPYS